MAEQKVVIEPKPGKASIIKCWTQLIVKVSGKLCTKWNYKHGKNPIVIKR